MKSPFPGMDPYLEDPGFWPEFHLKFINYWQEQIADVLPGHYEARIGEHVYVVEDLPNTSKQLGPDVMIARTRQRGKATAHGTGAATLEPVTIPLLILDPAKQGYIEVIHRPRRKVVALLELLSPTNKSGGGRQSYLLKRNELTFQKVHLVELDLLLTGRPLPFAQPLPPGHYHYFITRSNRHRNCDVYTWNLHDRLPTVPIPLLAADGDVLCDLGKVFSLAYDRGRLGQAIDYRKAPPMPLTAAEKKWARQQLRGRAT